MRASAVWYTDLYFAQPGGVAPYGELVVQGVDPDQGFVLGPIATLKWRR